MPPHDVGEHGYSGGIKRRAWFIEQPDWAGGDEQAGEREAPPLPGREIDGRQATEDIEPHRGERARDLVATAENAIPEGEVLIDSQRRLEGIEMPDVVGLLANREFRIAAAEGDVALGRL